jgi:hypothetical protein
VFLSEGLSKTSGTPSAGHGPWSGITENITDLKFTGSYKASTFIYILVALENVFECFGLHQGSDRWWDDSVKPRFKRFKRFNEGNFD